MSFKASADERLMEAPRKPPRDRLFMGVLAVCFAAHAAGVYLLLDRDRASPAAPAPEAIPVELVPEPPPPPPPPAEPPQPAQPQQPSPQQQATLDEKKAEDAPRAKSEEKAQRDAQNEKPKTDSPPPPSAKTIADEPVEAPTPPPAAPPILAASQPDASVAAPDLRRERVPDAPPPAPNPAQDAERARQKAYADLLASVQRAPNWEIGSSVRASPVGGGQANATYLSILFGLVKQNLHLPKEPPQSHGRIAGEIVFLVDRNGRVLQAHVARPSGVNSLDLAALTAIRSSSPFPPTPTGTPLSLVYSYSAH